MTTPAPDPAVVEKVARLMAAKDWLEDAADDAWWNRGSQKFRDDYLAFAEDIVRIVHAGDGAKEAS